MDEDTATVAAFRQGDQDAFARISNHHFRELHIHCYRMIGSFDEAEDLVQETFLRAWHRRDSYEGRASVRTWLYRIATNVCIDTIRARARRRIPSETDGVPKYSHFPWMQPYPDALLDAAGVGVERPDSRMVSRETIELAFLATIQLLPAKQRAALILRDILDFSAAETAELLDDTVAAVNSAHQRARAAVQRRRGTPAPVGGTTEVSFDDTVFVQVFIDAQERGDVDTIVSLLRDDVRMTRLPDGATWDGREEVACEFFERKRAFDGDVRSVPIAANRQPAVAVYLRPRGDREYRAWAVVLLGVLDGKLREIATFTSPDVFARFQLPMTLAEHRPTAP